MLRTRYPDLQARRAVHLVFTSVSAYFSLQTMPLGEFSAIVMLMPLLITLLASRTLGEKATMLNWLTVGSAFIVARLVIRPERDGMPSVSVSMPLALVACDAAFQIVTGTLARLADARTAHFYTGLIGALIATLVSWIAFAHAPDAWALAGIAVIALSGLDGRWLNQRHQLDRLQADRGRGLSPPHRLRAPHDIAWYSRRCQLTPPATPCTHNIAPGCAPARAGRC
jgi:hypothetical protein